MKKITVLVLCLLFCLCAFWIEAKEPTQEYGYDLEWIISDHLVRIVGGCLSIVDGGNTYQELGYGDSFKRALTFLSYKYTITQITPINYYHGINYIEKAGSLTKELLVFTKLK